LINQILFIYLMLFVPPLPSASRGSSSYISFRHQTILQKKVLIFLLIELILLVSQLNFSLQKVIVDLSQILQHHFYYPFLVI